MTPADGTLLDVTEIVLDNAAKLVLLNVPLHKPVPEEADQVESVVALIYPDQVRSFQEAGSLVGTQLVQTDVAATLDRIVEFRNQLDQTLMQVVQHLLFCIVVEVNFQHFVDLLLQAFHLVIVEALIRHDLKMR